MFFRRRACSFRGGTNKDSRWQNDRTTGITTHVQTGHQVIISFLKQKHETKMISYTQQNMFFLGGNKSSSELLPSSSPKEYVMTHLSPKKRFSYSPRDPCIMVILTYINTTNQKSTHSWMGKNIPVRPMEILCVGCVFLPTNSRISIDLIIHPSSTFPKVLRANANSLGKPSSVVVAENLWDECFGWEIFVVKKPAQKFNYKKNRSWW